MPTIRWHSYPLAFFTFLGVLLSLKVATLALWAEPDRHSDFISYYVAANLMLEGESPFDAELQLRQRISILGQEPAQGAVFRYFYPPPFLLLIAPFTAFSAATAHFVWTALQIFLIWVVCSYLLAKRTRGWMRSLMLAWWLIFLPTAICLKFGQVSILLLMCYLVTVQCLERKRDVAAGAWLAFLWIKPALIVLPIATVALQGRWRCIASCLLSYILAFGITMLLFAPNLLVEYLSTIAQALALQETNPSWRDSTYSVALFSSLPNRAGFATTLSFGIGTLILVLAIFRKRGANEGFSMLPVAGILLSPHVFLYDVVVSMAAVPILAKRATWLSMPLLVGGFSVVFVSHLVVQNPAATVLWHLLALIVVLLAPPVKEVRPSMNWGT